MPEVTLGKMPVGSLLRWKLHKPSIRKQRIQLLADTFRSKGIRVSRWQLDPIKRNGYHSPWIYWQIDYTTQSYKFLFHSVAIDVPLDYYYQPDQEWLAESIVTEYLLKTDTIESSMPWFTPAGLGRHFSS